MIKILSIRQPWAWMIVNNVGGKSIENRSWSTSYRGPILIHAGKSFDEDAVDGILDKLDWTEEEWPARDAFRCGGVVGVVRLAEIVTESTNPWFNGPYGWSFDRARSLPFLPLRGQLGLIDAPDSVVDQVRIAILQQYRHATTKDSQGEIR